jgi:hypothetical protein
MITRTISKPTLFGITGKSNRDTTSKSHWGKNEFNTSFPTALLCYMHSKKVKPILIKVDNEFDTYQEPISVEDLFGMNPTGESTYFSFEDSFTPFQGFVRGQLERSDLVIMDQSDSKNPWKRGFEIKLTALPDSSTYEAPDDQQSCEMVFRPTAVVHLALSIAGLFQNKRKQLLKYLSPVCSKVYNWRSKEEISALTHDFISALESAFRSALNEQEAFILQPIWKTVGKASILHDNCLDVFIWTNLAFTRLFIDTITEEDQRGMKRPQRCIFWLARMLFDFAQVGVITPSLIASEMAYGLQTDKAFSVSGIKSWKYLKSKQLTNPRIQKNEIKNIILGGGQHLLSPERRFDAAVVNTPGLFT